MVEGLPRFHQAWMCLLGRDGVGELTGPDPPTPRRRRQLQVQTKQIIEPVEQIRGHRGTGTRLYLADSRPADAKPARQLLLRPLFLFSQRSDLAGCPSVITHSVVNHGTIVAATEAMETYLTTATTSVK